LHLLAATAQAGRGQAPSRSLLEAVHHLAEVLPILRSAEPETAATPSRLLSRVHREEPARRAFEALRVNHPSVAAVVARAGAGPTATAVPGDEQRLGTPFGGVFVLLPALAEIDLERLLREAGLPEDDLHWSVPLGRWLVLLACLGPERRAAAHVDPALTLAAGLEAMPERAALRWLARVTTPLAGSLGGALVAWAERAHLTSGKDSVAEAVRAPSRRWVRLERDSGNGLWLRVAPLAHRPESVSPPADGLPSAAGEVAHFHLGGLLRGRSAGLAWSQIAAAVLNITARRIPGFAGSSAGYLCRNFLAGTSLVERDAGGVSVDLPRVPLQVVMRVAGTAGRYAIPWLPGGALLIDGREAYNPEHE
ncbi:MAG: hypothetical protein ACRDJE_00005, partial [Dehalococcoidia bacterium]